MIARLCALFLLLVSPLRAAQITPAMASFSAGKITAYFESPALTPASLREVLPSLARLDLADPAARAAAAPVQAAVQSAARAALQAQAAEPSPAAVERLAMLRTAFKDFLAEDQRAGVDAAWSVQSERLSAPQRAAVAAKLSRIAKALGPLGEAPAAVVPRESTFRLGDTHVLKLSRSSRPSSQAVVIFHGFPGQPPAGQEELYKGKPRFRFELAREINRKLGWTVYLPVYEGLGESGGTFSFEKSVERSAQVARLLADLGHERLHVAGHSWGALVAAHAHAGLGDKAGALALMAGLLDLSEPVVRQIISSHMPLYPDILGSGQADFEKGVADLDAARRRFNPMDAQPAAKASPKDLLVAYGKSDAAVDPLSSVRYHERFGGTLAAYDDDHVFSKDMARVIAETIRFLKKAARMKP